MQPEAIIFDVDGTLTDSEQTWDDLRRGLAAEHGVPWPEGTTGAMMGMSTPEWSSHLVEQVGIPGPPERVASATIEAMRAAYSEGRVPLLPGAAGAVRRMAALAPLGVASSSPSSLIHAALALLGVEDLVRAAVSTEEVERGKPAPDGYLEACRRLGADPGACLAVEDSSNGIRSALAAGLTVVAVPHPFHPPAEDALAGCAAVLTGLDELTADLVAGLA